MLPRTKSPRSLLSKRVQALICALCLCANSTALAEHTIKNGESKTEIISRSSTITNYYNSFGVITSSTTVSKQTVKTTSTNGETNKEITQTQTTTSTTTSKWMGSSVKPIETKTSGTMTSSDGGQSTTTGTTTYTYTNSGKLESCAGESTTTGTQANSSYTSNRTETYVIKDGQAIIDTSSSNTTYNGPDGTNVGNSTSVTKYEYEMSGGSWQVIKETSTDNSTYTNGGEMRTTTTKTYTRDSNGVISDVSQTKTGTRVNITSTGGKESQTLVKYEAEFKYSEDHGWHITKDTETWDRDSAAAIHKSDASSDDDSGDDDDSSKD
jgi:hypothetical protein